MLVVDDRRDSRYLAVHYLEEAAATVETAEDGDEAVAAVEGAARRGEPFEVVIMDMQMPVMDGFQATKKLRRMGFDVPIIALTAAATAADRDRCLEAGCDAYVAKPIRADELTKLVDQHLASSTPSADERADADETANSTTNDDDSADDASADEPSSSRRILLVEDNDDARSALEQLLTIVGGYDIETTEDGEEAIDVARQAEFDVVLLDLGLPDMTGYEVKKELATLDSMAETTFIALSGHSTAEAKEKTKEAGFAHHLVKPASLAELQEHLD